MWENSVLTAGHTLMSLCNLKIRDYHFLGHLCSVDIFLYFWKMLCVERVEQRFIWSNRGRVIKLILSSRSWVKICIVYTGKCGCEDFSFLIINLQTCSKYIRITIKILEKIKIFEYQEKMKKTATYYIFLYIQIHKHLIKLKIYWQTQL